MDIKSILKVAIVIALLVFAWKNISPRLKKSGGDDAETSGGGGGSCVQLAERAANAWGNGIGRFANPPYDVDAWSSFSGDVQDKISAAQSACDCEDDSCAKASAAMNDLSGLVGDLDAAIQDGSQPPGDLVRRQESIDGAVEQARDLVRSGK